jgi:hypothetical protein
MKVRYTYQLYGDCEIYSSKIKAHNQLCKLLGKDKEKFFPYKEKQGRSSDWTEICYPNGHTIIKRPLK